jgi:hypothetical protein
MSVSLSSILRGRVGRAVYDFDQYWAYHLTQERRRVHQTRYADNVIPMAA